jgi:hypothetical protein
VEMGIGVQDSAQVGTKMENLTMFAKKWFEMKQVAKR